MTKSGQVYLASDKGGEKFPPLFLSTTSQVATLIDAP